MISTWRPQTDGGVLVATGPEGRLYRVEAQTATCFLLTGVDARQITRFARGARAAPRAAFATANPGRVVAVGTGAQSPATLRLERARHEERRHVGPDSLGRDGRRRAVHALRQHRTPDDSWSDWSPAYTRARGRSRSPVRPRGSSSGVPCSRARHAAPAPSLTGGHRRLSAAQQSRRRSSSITVHPPGVVFQRPFVNDESAIAGLDDVGDRRAASAGRHRPTARRAQSPHVPEGPADAWRGRPTTTTDDRSLHAAATGARAKPRGANCGRAGRQHLSSGTRPLWPTGATWCACARPTARRMPPTARLTGERDSDPIDVDNTPPALEVTRAARAARAGSTSWRATPAARSSGSSTRSVAARGAWSIRWTAWPTRGGAVRDCAAGGVDATAVVVA